MNDTTIRVIIAAIGAAILIGQGLRAGPQLWRGRAFFAGAAAFACFGGANFFVGSSIGPILTNVGITCLIVALGLLILSYQRGEMASQMQRLRTEVEAERQRREQKSESKDRS